MFNLIVSSDLQYGRRGSMLATRVLEYTSDELQNRFNPNGQLDVESALKLPTLFMGEGIGDEGAQIGWLQRVELNGGSYQLHFSIDQSLPRMTNSDVCGLASELDMDSFEFHRNHWAIKDVDLFYVLYQRKLTNGASPSVFELSDKPVNENLVSFMMPFSEPFNAVYRDTKGV